MKTKEKLKLNAEDSLIMVGFGIGLIIGAILWPAYSIINIFKKGGQNAGNNS